MPRTHYSLHEGPFHGGEFRFGPEDRARDNPRALTTLQFQVHGISDSEGRYCTGPVRREEIGVPENRRLEPTWFVGSSQRAGFQFCGANASHETAGFQFVNAPFGFSFHAQTCSV